MKIKSSRFLRNVSAMAKGKLATIHARDTERDECMSFTVGKSVVTISTRFLLHPSYAIKAALTNSGPSTLDFLRLDPRKYTKLHLNALFSVQFTRLVPNFIATFLSPMENGSPLSFLPIFFFKKRI